VSLSRRTLLTLAPAFLPAQAPLIVRTDFEGGSAGDVEQTGPRHLRVKVKGQADQAGRNRQANWYYFRVIVPEVGEEVTIDLVDLPGEYNFVPNRGAVTADTRPYVQEAGVWREALGEYDAAEPRWRLRVRPQGRDFFIAHLPPYTQKNLWELHNAVKPKVEVIGKSVGGRNLELWNFDRAGGDPKAPTVWLMFRQHAWEAGTSWIADGMLRGLRYGVHWKVLPLCDPDGVAEGGVRFNRNGFDFNRNWDVEDAVQMPEIAAQKAAIEKWLAAGRRIDLFLTLHNTETSEYLEGPPDSPLGKRLYEALVRGSKFDPSREYFSRMEVTDKGRANVVQYLWNRHKIEAMLMEARIGFSKKLGARPGPESWKGFGQALGAQVFQSVRGI
jgi:hypothetical protein